MIQDAVGKKPELWIEDIHLTTPCLRNPPAAILMDLDGTLIRKDQQLCQDDIKALEYLGQRNWIRAIVTGRSLESFRRAIPDFTRIPIDYLIYSSGVGIVNTQNARLVRTINLTPRSLDGILPVLNFLKLDYMIHHPAPDNVHFSWWRNSCGETNPDFTNRVSIYDTMNTPLISQPDTWSQPSAQVICVVPPGNPDSILEDLYSLLPDFTVVRTTSPLDKKSTWIEIYPKIVSKGKACQWLVNALGNSAETIALGNDYNDLDMLEWADKACVVADSPDALTSRFLTLPPQTSVDSGIISICLTELGML